MIMSDKLSIGQKAYRVSSSSPIGTVISVVNTLDMELLAKFTHGLLPHVVIC